MTRRRRRRAPLPRGLLLAVIALAGAGIAALSLVPAWLLHVRDVGGHGLTAISVVWSAWEGRAIPFLPVAAILAAGLAALAVATLVSRKPIRPGWLVSLSALCLALLIGSAVPLGWEGFSSAVHLTPHWALLASLALAALALASAAALVGGGRWLLPCAVVLLALSATTFGGRVLALNLAEGNPRHYADGSYLREATGGQPTETLVISDGTFSVGGRWSGTISGRGLVAVLTDDPACPDDRGSYRVFAAGGQDIRWDLILDLCANDERARDLTTGTWVRQP